MIRKTLVMRVQKKWEKLRKTFTSPGAKHWPKRRAHALSNACLRSLLKSGVPCRPW
jgi:hypothetical protein